MAARPRLPAVLREEPQFRLLFAGQAASMIGDRVTFVVLPFAVLSIAGASTADVGLVVAATTLPFALLSLVAGVVGDRVDRRRLMLASDLARLAVQALVAVLLLGGGAEVWQLTVLGALYGTADAFFTPAATGLLPQVVSAARLQEANALRGLVLSTGLVVGPALAGVLVALAGPGGAIALDAGTFALSALALARLRPRPAAAPVAPRAHGAGFLGELRGGWHEVRSRSWVSSALGAMLVYHVIVLPSVFVLGPVLFDDRYGGASAWAIVVAAFGLGSVAGDVFVLRHRPRRPLRLALLGLVVASCQAAIIGSGASVGVIAALEGVTGVAVSLFFTLWETTLQEQIPPHAISRVSSYDFFVSTGLSPIGVLLAAPVAAAVGLRATLLGMTAIGVAASLACFAVPAVRRLERPPRAGAVPGEPLPATTSG